MHPQIKGGIEIAMFKKLAATAQLCHPVLWWLKKHRISSVCLQYDLKAKVLDLAQESGGHVWALVEQRFTAS